MSVPADFVQRAAALGVSFDKGDVERLDRFLSMLLERNTQFNLTAIRDETAAWERHILDSLTLMGLVTSARAKRVADVGSGGGLPGMVLAICLPDVEFTLIEATGKKARFLEDVARALELANVQVLCDRAETIGGQGGIGRERFDVVLARAVGPMNVTLELTAGLSRVGGIIAIIKGQKAEEELRGAGEAMRRLRTEHAKTMATPTGRVVVFGKSGRTPGKYPRSPGEVKKSPLR